MKAFVAISLLAFTFSSFAKTAVCRKLERLAEIGDTQFAFADSVGPGPGYHVLSAKDGQDLPSTLTSYQDTDTIRRCRGAFTVAEFTMVNAQGTFRLSYSTEDRCDGGNTFGQVINIESGEEVAFVQDGDLLCE